eukprot:CAMPEP_0116060236 /NCGR_PEP_ID=MMETSP0322-20121206/6288_1 /TAXON_ID=163516 /ORGANISM="Leptocylindrus danicus var. apora, Strain B651" /LENGTH=384 /DNA_ID=CAMNT_0003544803 /DNA_START=138 /DNA_END=1293 /DNA_ORIENTATION=-
MNSLGPTYDDDDDVGIVDVENKCLVASYDSEEKKLNDRLKGKRAKGKGILDSMDDDIVSDSAKEGGGHNYFQAILTLCRSRPYTVGMTLIVALVFICGGKLFGKNDSDLDFSHVDNIQELELSLGKIHHWCINGDDSSCSCEDPLVPQSGSGREWHEKFNLNKHDAEDFAEQVSPGNQDMVILGDDVVAMMNAQITKDTTQKLKKQKIIRKFKSTFSRDDGGSMDAVPLGIEGDRATNVLWRIRNGELPDELRPKIFWVMIGLRDIRTTGCSSEVTSMSIIRLVEEIQIKRPGSKIVLNGIMPSAGKNGFAPQAWHTSMKVNVQLRKFSENHDNVFYFDLSKFFLEFNGKKAPTVSSELYDSDEMLNPAGFEFLYERKRKKRSV